MQAKEEQTKAEGKAEHFGHRPTRVWGIHQSLRGGFIVGGGGHHCKQGGCAESEIDGAEQMAAGETPELDAGTEF